MEKVKEITITEIEALTEQEAAEMALEKLDIKGHTVYLVDFGGYFGYSALVYLNHHHIHYANDYELHHKSKSKEELRQWYIDTMSRKLFAEAEMETVVDYDDERAKRNYLHNYYGVQHDCVSIFHIFHNDEEEKAYEKQTAKMILNPIAFAYYAPELSGFVKHHTELFEKLVAAKNKLNDSFDYWKKAFLYEMWNHEYAINWQADYDVIGCFGSVSEVVDYENPHKLMEAAGFTEVMKKAYAAAQAQYYHECREREVE